MRKTFTSIFLSLGIAFFAQTQIPNAGFENWEGSGSSVEPTSWNSNKTGTGLASSGPQTCYQETSGPHSGSSCVRVETKYYILAVVNGNVTSGVVNAPSTNKSEGYLSATGSNKFTFTDHPDSLVGYYKYNQATGGTNAAQEQGKVLAIIHTGDYYDPATPVNGNHSDLSANKVGDALFLTPQSNVNSWQRFSVPFVYTSTVTPAYIMVNITSSNDQNTAAPNSSSTGSKLWVDDLELIYNPAGTGVKETDLNKFINAFYFDKNLNVDLSHVYSTKPLDITVYDLTGKCVKSMHLENQIMNKVSLNELNSGMFLYQIKGADFQKTGKFIVE